MTEQNNTNQGRFRTADCLRWTMMMWSRVVSNCLGTFNLPPVTRVQESSVSQNLSLKRLAWGTCFNYLASRKNTNRTEERESKTLLLYIYIPKEIKMIRGGEIFVVFLFFDLGRQIYKTHHHHDRQILSLSLTCLSCDLWWINHTNYHICRLVLLLPWSETSNYQLTNNMSGLWWKKQKNHWI